jgi:hypothetical protein
MKDKDFSEKMKVEAYKNKFESKCVMTNIYLIFIFD